LPTSTRFLSTSARSAHPLRSTSLRGAPWFRVRLQPHKSPSLSAFPCCNSNAHLSSLSSPQLARRTCCAQFSSPVLCGLPLPCGSSIHQLPPFSPIYTGPPSVSRSQPSLRVCSALFCSLALRAATGVFTPGFCLAVPLCAFCCPVHSLPPPRSLRSRYPADAHFSFLDGLAPSAPIALGGQTAFGSRSDIAGAHKISDVLVWF
jgi:hypothetical protein